MLEPRLPVAGGGQGDAIVARPRQLDPECPAPGQVQVLEHMAGGILQPADQDRVVVLDQQLVAGAGREVEILGAVATTPVRPGRGGNDDGVPPVPI